MFSGLNRSRQDAPPPYSDQSPSSSDNSLATLLPTQAHKIQCALLILLCTDTVRKAVVATFELPTADIHEPKPEDLISFDADEAPASGLHVSADLIARRKEELAKPKTQALKKAALEYFDSWRAKVLRRTCDALGVRAETVRVARKQYQGQEATQKSDQENRTELSLRHAATPTALLKLQHEKRVLLLECLVLLMLSLESYSAHSRILLLHISASLGLDHETLSRHESTVAKGLLSAASQMSGEEARKGRAAENSSGAAWKIGLATVGGAVLLGVTGGLAAPLLAAGLGTVFGGLGLGAVSTLLGALASNTVLIASLFGAYGGKMTGQIMERYEREVEDFRFLPIRHSLGETTNKTRPSTSRTTSDSNEGRHKLRVAIGISGSLTNEEDMILPWSILNKSSIESFALRWEVAALLRLGVSLSSVLKSYAWQYAKWELARRTLFSAVAAGLWPLGLLKMAKIVDNPFSVARARADKAGKVLADALIERCQGERPVTLIGYSVGARVIYSCLLELADRKAFGLIENVVLMGAPTPSDSEPWTKLRSVVSGRLINFYSTEDYILGFLYRASSGQFEVAGLQTIEGVNGVENFDLSAQVKGHTRYRYMIGQILQRTGFEDVDPSEVEREYAILKALDSDEQKQETRTPEIPAYDETARIEERIRQRVGSLTPSTPTHVDEAEEKRRQDLLRAAEARETSKRGGAPPAYEDIPQKSASSFSTSAATRRPDVSTIRSPVTHSDVTSDIHHLSDKTTTLSITDKKDAVEDVDDGRSVTSEVDSVRSGPLEMMHIAPVPEDDDDSE